MILKRILLKTFISLTIILLAVLIHYFVSNLGLKGSQKGMSLIINWAFCIIFLMYNFGFYENSKRNYSELRNAEIDFDLFGRKAKKAAHIEKNGKFTIATVTKVSKIRLGGYMSPLNPDCYVVEYEYCDDIGNTYKGLKGLYDTVYKFIPSVPAVDDKIRIVYNNSYAQESIIDYMKADKVPWYKIQQKYKIVLANNIKN